MSLDQKQIATSVLWKYISFFKTSLKCSETKTTMGGLTSDPHLKKKEKNLYVLHTTCSHITLWPLREGSEFLVMHLIGWSVVSIT